MTNQQIINSRIQELFIKRDLSGLLTFINALQADKATTITTLKAEIITAKQAQITNLQTTLTKAQSDLQDLNT